MLSALASSALCGSMVDGRDVSRGGGGGGGGGSGGNGGGGVCKSRQERDYSMNFLLSCWDGKMLSEKRTELYLVLTGFK